MKNWKTTLSSIAAAIIMISTNYQQNGTVKITDLVNAVGMVVVGFFAKDAEGKGEGK